MNALIANRRKKIFGTHQDGKKLTLDEIKTFFDHKDIAKIMKGLLEKGYLKETNGRYNPVAGNMSFEVFKFLDPNSISITLVTSDAHKLGVVHNGRVRRVTPRECARMQGFPDSFKCHPIDTFAYRQFGNSVSVPVVRNVILDLFKHSDILFYRSHAPRGNALHELCARGVPTLERQELHSHAERGNDNRLFLEWNNSNR